MFEKQINGASRFYPFNNGCQTFLLDGIFSRVQHLKNFRYVTKDNFPYVAFSRYLNFNLVDIFCQTSKVYARLYKEVSIMNSNNEYKYYEVINKIKMFLYSHLL